MHLLALLDTPDDGAILVEGTDAGTLAAPDLNKLRNDTFGFVFQQFFMIPNASVLENVMLPLKIAGVPRTERAERAMQVLTQVEMADKAKNRATALSGGQKQRMVIARALANEPRIIFADEPTGNLDSATSAVVGDLLFGFNKEDGITLVLVTHDEDLAARCDRRIYISDGVIADEVTSPPANPNSQVYA